MNTDTINIKEEFQIRKLQNKITARVFGPKVAWEKKLALNREQ